MSSFDDMGLRRVAYGTDQQAAERPQWLATSTAITSAAGNDTNNRPRTRVELLASRRAADTAIAAAHLIASAPPDARRMQSELAATFHHNPPLPIAAERALPPPPIVRVWLGSEEEWMEQLPDGTQRHVVAESPPSMRVKKRQVPLTKITQLDVKSQPVKARHTQFTSEKYHDRSVPATAKDDIPVGGDRWWHEYARVRQQRIADEKYAAAPVFSSFAPDGLFHEPYYMDPPQPVARSMAPKKIPSMAIEWRASDMIEYQAAMLAAAQTGVPLPITYQLGTPGGGIGDINNRSPSALDGLLPVAAWPKGHRSRYAAAAAAATANGTGANDGEEKVNDNLPIPSSSRSREASPSSPVHDTRRTSPIPASPSPAPLPAVHTPSMSPSPSLSSLRAIRNSGMTRAISVSDVAPPPLLSRMSSKNTGEVPPDYGIRVRTGLNRQASTGVLPSATSTTSYSNTPSRSQSAMAHSDYFASSATLSGNGDASSPNLSRRRDGTPEIVARAVTAGRSRRARPSSRAAATASMAATTSPSAWRSSSPSSAAAAVDDTPSSPYAAPASSRHVNKSPSSSATPKGMRHSYSTGTVHR